MSAAAAGRRSASVVTAAVLAIALTGPLWAPHDPNASVALPLEAPSSSYLLGTDLLGRDVLSRILHGGWVMVLLASAALVLAYAIALPLGVLAGLGRRAEGWIMRPVDAFVVVPWFLVLAVLATAYGSGATALIAAAVLGSAPWIIKLVRSATHELATAGFVEAARARGESPWRVALLEVAPNLRGVVLADAGVRVTGAVTIVTIGGYLGLGLPPPRADWATMVTENAQGLSVQAWASLAPATLILVLVVSVNVVADGLAPLQSGRVPRPVRTRGTTGRVLSGETSAGEGLRVEGLHVEGLRVQGLSVRTADGTPIVEDVDLSLGRGRCLAVTGPSGAGKSTLARALLGEAPDGWRIEGAVSSGRIALVPQDPPTSLNPALTVRAHLREVQRAAGGSSGWRTTDGSIEDVLRSVGLDPALYLRRFPHQLSGGQQQRVLVAMALLPGPEVIVLDEPTTGQDVAARASLVATLAGIVAEHGTSLVIVTHELDAVRDLVDDVLVLDGGRVRRRTPIADHPRQGQVRLGTASLAASAPVLAVRGLHAGYGRRPAVVTDLSFSVGSGECVALSGRSGAGKSTVARCLVGLHRPASGRVELGGVHLPAAVGARSVQHRRAVQIVFQNPRSSLNPLRTVHAEIARPMRLLRGLDRERADDEVLRLAESLGLEVSLLARRSGELSGGQQQRVAIARALAAGPQVLVCDEITTALDPETQRGLLDLLDERRRRDGLALVVVSHDATVIDRLADRVVEVDEGRSTKDRSTEGGSQVSPAGRRTASRRARRTR